MIHRIIEITEVSEAQLAETFDNMDQNRKRRCLRFRCDQDKKRMLAGEFLAKKLAAEELGINMEKIRLVNLESGRPEISAKGRKLYASISHSGNFGAAAVSQTAVGIDIEAIRDVPEGVVKRAFSEDEADFVYKAQSEEEKKQRFLRIWTAKEAYLKLKGTGLKGLDDAFVLPFVLGEERTDFKFKQFVGEGFVCSLFISLK